jgi:YidC/Oxa1 family membrane protein insertase
MVISLLQAPFFITMFLTLKRMAGNIESFQWGGLLWFMDLSASDPSWLLPIISCVFINLSMEVRLLLEIVKYENKNGK